MDYLLTAHSFLVPNPVFPQLCLACLGGACVPLWTEALGEVVFVSLRSIYCTSKIHREIISGAVKCFHHPCVL